MSPRKAVKTDLAKAMVSLPLVKSVTIRDYLVTMPESLVTLDRNTQSAGTVLTVIALTNRTAETAFSFRNSLFGE